MHWEGRHSEWFVCLGDEGIFGHSCSFWKLSIDIGIFGRIGYLFLESYDLELTMFSETPSVMITIRYAHHALAP